ncbi:hypothetical protein P9C93_15080 [Bacillus safensis]|uniref:hypothetical protein n=1 Tax=Bacillus safensis TaxID=561879 RepID=UPI002DBA74C5|nr:hypothetical protein [Bacillus safensis]MEC1411919.1 hypothetical protein [Bacillus safensis]
MENINSVDFVRIFEYLGDEVSETKPICKQSGDSIVLHLPNKDNFNYKWYSFDWTIEKTETQKILPVTLVSKELLDNGSYKLDFFNFASKPVNVTVRARFEKYRLTIFNKTFENFKKGVVNMDNTYNSPVLVYPQTLTVNPEKAETIDIDSPNGYTIVDVFFVDISTNNNKKTALTGKQFISNTKWSLSFHNTDTKVSATLGFFVRTLPF